MIDRLIDSLTVGFLDSWIHSTGIPKEVKLQSFMVTQMPSFFHLSTLYHIIHYINSRTIKYTLVLVDICLSLQLIPFFNFTHQKFH